MRPHAIYCFLLLCAPCLAVAQPVTTVRDTQSLEKAFQSAKPGTEIRIASGIYRGGLFFSKVSGIKGKPIVIRGADPQNPPVFEGGNSCLQFSACAYFELRDVVIRGAKDNGLNIDDGGNYSTPLRGIVVSGVKVRDIGDAGNHDGIKLSGLDDFVIEKCEVERWGLGQGSAVDMVGCHKGILKNNVFRHREETAETGNTGVQAKGGCTDLTIERNLFENAGGRGVNIGGATGLEYFRPPLKSLAGQPLSEARNIVVKGNTFIGGGCAVAFVGVDGAIVQHNTIYRPKRWAFRILQETRAPGFVPARKGVFIKNLIVFRGDASAANIGDATSPETFYFAENAWYREDAPDRSRPELPTRERAGIYGRAPRFRNVAKGDLRLEPNSGLSGAGIDGLP